MAGKFRMPRRRFLIAIGSSFTSLLAAACRRHKPRDVENGLETYADEAEWSPGAGPTPTVEARNSRRITVSEFSIAVKDVARVDALRPVTGGVPISRGTAPEGCMFALLDDKGDAVPVQTSILARWDDGSARWVLVDLLSRPPAGGAQGYKLLVGDEVASGHVVRVDQAVVAQEGVRGPELSSGEVSLSLGKSGILSISDRLEVAFSLEDDQGQTCQAVVESSEVEVEGEIRSTLCLRGAFYAPQGQRLFQWRLRASVYAGLAKIRLEPLIFVDAESGILQRIRSLRLEFRPRSVVRLARLGGRPGWEGQPGSPFRLLQYDDQNYRVEKVPGGDDAEFSGRKAPGWAELQDDIGDIAVALRDFWQQWPKSLEVSPDGLAVGLLPSFTEGTYAHMEPWYKYQYLFAERSYQLRTGQARRWDVWIDLDGDGSALAQSADAPLLPILEPAQAIATGVWGPISPAGAPGMADYDAWADNLFEGYTYSIEAQRDYGAMNWGDWFGERQVNWGNHEYDTTDQILVQFARTGDPKYFYVADSAARHSSEVDTVHYVNEDLARHFVKYWRRPGYPPRAGMVHQHAVGHVGSFYPVERIRRLFIERGIGHPVKPYLCLDPTNLGHVWTQGMVRQYFLTGDPFLRQTVCRIADNLAQLVEDREYQFMGHTHSGRTTGWPLLALAGAYEIDLDDRYLAAMKSLTDDALADQDPVCGGWLIHPMAWDHCPCETARHTGMAGFITAILINGISRYCELSGDDRLPEAIDKAVSFLDNDTWREEWRDWRYTSCPATKQTNQPGVVMMAHVNGARIAGGPLTPNPQHLRILAVAWKAKFKRLRQSPPPRPGLGKTYTSQMYGCAETVSLLSAHGTDVGATL